MNNVYYDWPLILAYHSIHPNRTDMLSVQSDEFSYHLDWLSRHGYRSMTLSDFCQQDISHGERIVIITFDDGYEDNYIYAWPILKLFGFVATIFLSSDFVGKKKFYWWDEPRITIPDQRSWYSLLNWEQVSEMSAAGIEFGSHAHTHVNLTSLEPAQYRYEIVQSRSELGRHLGKVSSFCYPRGDLNDDVVSVVEQAGYQCAVVTPPRAKLPLNRFALRRVGMYKNTSRLLFRVKVLPFVRRYKEQSMGAVKYFSKYLWRRGLGK